jgi:hypothetical protein
MTRFPYYIKLALCRIINELEGVMSLQNQMHHVTSAPKNAIHIPKLGPTLTPLLFLAVVVAAWDEPVPVAEGANDMGLPLIDSNL